MAKSYLRFWGVRGSYAAPFPTHLKVGGNTSCVEVNVDGHVLICDAGTGIIPLGDRLAKEAKNKELLIVLTHYHWDHICGLPFFVPAFIPDWNINFFGPGESIQEMKQKLDSQMQAPYFPVGTETWMAKINYINPRETKLSTGPIDISYYSVHHPGVTYGYKIKAGNKTIIYVSDNECQFLDKSIKQKMTEFSEEEQNNVRGYESRRVRIRVRNDTRPLTSSFTTRNTPPKTMRPNAAGVTRAMSMLLIMPLTRALRIYISTTTTLIMMTMLSRRYYEKCLDILQRARRLI